MRSDQILTREPRTVVKGVVIRRDPSLIEKTTKNLKAAFHRAGGAFFASEETKKNFSMQILADFVNHPHILNERLGLVAGQDQRLILQTAGSFVPTTRRGRSSRGHGESGDAGQ